MIRTAALLAALLLGACAPTMGEDAARRDIARAFVDLTFTNEGGQRRAVLGRWAGPVTVHLDPAFGAQAAFLDDHLADLSAVTGLDITRVLRGPAAIRIVAGPVQGGRDVLCTAAFTGDWRVVPRFAGGIVRMPRNTGAFRVRQCLIEEITQLLGPINDLARLPDSVFNDDQAHHRLTDFDRMILSLLYDARMPEGASRAQAEAAARDILEDRQGLSPLPRAAPGWREAYGAAALARINGDMAGVLRALERAEAALEGLPEDDHRRLKTLSGRAFALLPDDPEQAAAVARRAIGAAPAGSIRGAEASLILARALRRMGQAQAAREAANAALPVARAHGRDDLAAALRAI